MTIQPINECDLALFIGKSDLELRGLSPDTLSISDARQMAYEAFAKAGLECGRQLEIEAFATNCGLLVFVRKAQPQWGIWVFSDFEDMADALCALGCPGIKASIIHCGGKWYICTASHEACYVLDEYAQRLVGGEAFYAHLREHGETVLDDDLSGTICPYFSTMAQISVFSRE